MRFSKLIIFLSLLTSTFCFAQNLGYKSQYDFEQNGDSWYGVAPKQHFDFYPATQFPTQEGDDFCVAYEPTLIHYSQGSALLRTQEKHSAYAFKYTATTDTSYCPPIPPPMPLPNLIFTNGFE